MHSEQDNSDGHNGGRPGIGSCYRLGTWSTTNAYAQSGKETKIDIVKDAASVKDGTKVFAPNPAKMQPGTKVMWTNGDSVIHTVTSGKGPSDKDSGKMFDSKVLAPKKEFSLSSTRRRPTITSAFFTLRWRGR
jgi:plastocyanin